MGALARQWLDEGELGADEFFASHGIAPQIWKTRPYLRWTPDDVEPIRHAYAGLKTAPTIVGWARQSAGWIITRHPPPGIGAPDIYPEIRPDAPIRTQPPRRHYHGTPDLTSSDLFPKHIHKPDSMAGHIARDKAIDDHHGVNVDVVHVHADLAKYIFPPAPKVERRWEHDHDRYRQPEARLRHVEYRHAGVEVTGRHRHVNRVKDENSNLARRLDVHPLTLPLLTNAETIFFALEGCLKADAILTAGGAVVSVPSVTLWDADELPAFASKYLLGKRVVIVMDADWFNNGAVLTQGFLVQTALQRHGVYNVLLAAPPAGGGNKGVDDHLAAGRPLSELDVMNRVVGPLVVVREAGGRTDRWRRNYNVLASMVYHADTNGRLQLSLRSLARRMGVHVTRVTRALDDLIEADLVHIEGSLKSRRGWFSRQLEWSSKTAPVIVIRSDLRAYDAPPKPLSIFLSKTEVRHIEEISKVRHIEEVSR